MTTLMPYRSAPDAAEFRLADTEELRSLLAEFEAGEGTTEWGRDALATDTEACRKALVAAEHGERVLLARDDDGYYFATA